MECLGLDAMWVNPQKGNLAKAMDVRGNKRDALNLEI
jgi:hypothetical protein